MGTTTWLTCSIVPPGFFRDIVNKLEIFWNWEGRVFLAKIDFNLRIFEKDVREDDEVV